MRNLVIAKIDEKEKMIDLYLRNENGWEILIGAMEKEKTIIDEKRLKDNDSKTVILIDKIEPKVKREVWK